MKTTGNNLLIKLFILLITVCISLPSFVPFKTLAQDERVTASDAAMVGAAAFTEQQKLAASDGAASDAYGRAVALSGNTAVIGAPLADVNGKADQGVAYVYVFENGIWTPQAKLIASNGNAESQFGYAVDIDGDTIVIGARRTAPSDKGAVYIFVRSGANWTQTARLTGSDSVEGDRFGEAVAINGKTIVVGAPFHDTTGTPDIQKGAAYVFTRNGTTWVEQAKLTASNPLDYDFFGDQIDVDGDTVLISAPQGSGDVRLGSVYVFTRTGSTWNQQAILVSNDRVPRDDFGESVSLYGDTAVIGASEVAIGGNELQGAVYAFTRSGVNWSQQAKLTANDLSKESYFGFTVSLQDDWLVVGAYKDKHNQGSAYLFRRSGAVWEQQTKLTAPNSSVNDQFGFNVDIAGNFIAVGMPQIQVNLFNGVTTPEPGAAYIFSTTAVSDGAPQIHSVQVQGKKLLVTGANFEVPALIFLNGAKQKKTVNDEFNPTTKVIGLKAGNLIAPGQTVVVQVKNTATGKISNEFIFTRPVD